MFIFIFISSCACVLLIPDLKVFKCRIGEAPWLLHTVPLNRASEQRASAQARAVFSFLQPEELSSVAALGNPSLPVLVMFWKQQRGSFVSVCLLVFLPSSRRDTTALLFTRRSRPEELLFLLCVCVLSVSEEEEVVVVVAVGVKDQRIQQEFKVVAQCPPVVGTISLPAPTSLHIHVDCGSPRTGLRGLLTPPPPLCSAVDQLRLRCNVNQERYTDGTISNVMLRCASLFESEGLFTR